MLVTPVSDGLVITASARDNRGEMGSTTEERREVTRTDCPPVRPAT